MFAYVDGQTITIETLEGALDHLAIIMSEASDGGVTYLPIWRRLESELDALKARSSELSAVEARLHRVRARAASAAA